MKPSHVGGSSIVTDAMWMLHNQLVHVVHDKQNKQRGVMHAMLHSQRKHLCGKTWPTWPYLPTSDPPPAPLSSLDSNHLGPKPSQDLTDPSPLVDPTGWAGSRRKLGKRDWLKPRTGLDPNMEDLDPKPPDIAGSRSSASSRAWEAALAGRCCDQAADSAREDPGGDSGCTFLVAIMLRVLRVLMRDAERSTLVRAEVAKPCCCCCWDSSSSLSYPCGQQPVPSGQCNSSL